jgi:hypothetical protein
MAKAAWAILMILVPRWAAAQEEIVATEVGAESAREAVGTGADGSEAIAAIVRGLYVEARLGGGLMLKSASLADSVINEHRLSPGASEDLGSGAFVHLTLGYDLNDFFAVQASGGVTLVAGTRGQEPVRDLSMAFVGMGARLAFKLAERLHVLASMGVVYLSADNAIESPKTGVAVLAGSGIEYYVHVRHFSVGIDVSVLAPLSPLRLFVGVGPTIKYTFF